MNGPYKGLAAFEDDDLDAELFFGRDRERAIVTANLMASRLTVLYGASGVGKSSLLCAGVAHQLRRAARTGDERHGEPEHAVVLFGSWSDDPLPALIEAVADSVEPRLEESTFRTNGTPSLALVLERASQAIEGDVYVILDQFEEFFVYHDGADAEQFGAELAEVVRTEGLRVNVLVSLRDDALAELDRFAGKLPAVLANSVRVEHLDRGAGRAAIVQPLERYAALTRRSAVAIEDNLVNAVLDEVDTGKLSVAESGVRSADGGGATSRIEAPYLQLVMERLWGIETAAGSATLRLSTFRDLGGATPIVEAHFEDAIDALPPAQQALAARVFGHLVTPSGTKIAHGQSDLARYAEVDDAELEPVLLSLAEARILRPVATPDGGRGSARFELYHDVLAEPVLAWKRRFETERALDAERAAAARRQRRLVAIVAAALVALAAMVAVTVFALTQRSEAREQASIARSRQLAASASSELPTDPELAVLLALEAARARETPEAENALRQALIATRAELVLSQEGEAVQAAAATADGQVEAISAAGTLRRFDARTGELVTESAGNGPNVTAAFDPTGAYAASAEPGGVVRVFDPGSGEEISTVDHGDSIAGLSFSENGAILVTAGRDGRARVWRTTSGSPLAVVDHGAALTSAAVSPSETVLATAGRDGVTRLWSIPSAELVREIEGHRGVVADVAFSHDGAALVTGGTDGLARVVDVATGDLLATLIGHGNSITAVAFSPDDRWIATGSRDRSARIWKRDSGRLAAVLLGHAERVTSVGFDPASEIVVTGSADGTARLWAASSDQTLVVLARVDGPALGAVFVPGENTIAVAGPGGKITLVDASSGSTVTTLTHDDPVVDVGPGGPDRVLAAVGAEGLLQTLLKGDIVGRFAHGGQVAAAAMSSDGAHVATAGQDGIARVYGADTAEMEVQLGGDSGPLTDVAFSPDGTLLATAGADKVARIWNLETREVEHELRGHRDDVTSVSFSPDGQSIVTSSRDHDARVWTVATGELVHVLRAHFAAVQDAQFSPDGRWIVTAGPTTAGLWEAGSGEFRFYLRGHEGLLTSASFGPDSRQIVTTSEDGTVRIFTCRVCGTLDELQALAKERLGRLDRALTETERARFVN